MTGTAWNANLSFTVFRLVTFGGLGIEADNGATAPRLRPPRLALLAVLAAAGHRGMSRDKLTALFWPDSDEERARHSLRQNLYALRTGLGRDVVRSIGQTLALDETTIGADVADFRAALASGDREQAVLLARGTFLDGFYLQGSSGFELWAEEERARLTAETISALHSLATAATRANQYDAAAEWWRQLTQRDPVSGRFALGYSSALTARGDRATALAFIRHHEAIVRRELQAEPDPEVLRLEAELRAAPGLEIKRMQTSGANGSGRSQIASESVPRLTAPDNASTLASEPSVSAARKLWASRVARWSLPALLRSRRAMALAAIVGFAVLGAGFVTRRLGWLRAPARTSTTIAVGFIREDTAAVLLGTSRVLTDMIATDLARVEGLAVLANSRLIELMRSGQDSAAGYADAARRAGASELLEGQLVVLRRDTLELAMRRVELRTGIVKDAYRVRAVDRYALVDSLTQSIARRFRLQSPPVSIADATTRSPLAYRLYEEGLRAYFQNDWKAAQRLMNAALGEDSTFAMAAYWVVKLGKDVWEPVRHQDVSRLRPIALRLASRAPDRERLMITADLLTDDQEPRAIAVAESLTVRYPRDPRAFGVLGHVYWMSGDWPKAVSAVERAVALDSAGERDGGSLCMLCEDFVFLANVYFWSDSLPAVVRVAHRFRALRPKASYPFFLLGTVATRRGDSASAYENFQNLASLGGTGQGYLTGLHFGLEAYDQAEQRLATQLSSSLPNDYDTGAWWYILALRNQGRIREAEEFFRTGTLPGLPPAPATRDRNAINEGILALARGDAQAAAEVFGRILHLSLPQDWSAGTRARHRAWNGTLYGMALAAAGDTVALRALADSVEVWGGASLYGRDRRTHHYLRGMLQQAAGRHSDAVREFQAAIHSPTMGFTRVNYELARCLIQLGRPREAIAALQAALRGDIEAGALYVTHTELHEALAQAFDSARMTDSAAVHYRAVIKAWQRADREFLPRRGAAQTWLARHEVAIKSH
ncbi:MAG TPA: tetratricopeptide repeat protein [Gemmatimonadaceae bacterium]|nr:tetratricopeptide repeat protein [Gemmatimonadaceae bacterium]